MVAEVYFMIKDTKTIVVIAVVAILLVAGIAVVVANNNGGNEPKHTDIADMTWDEIVDAAKGTNVNIGFYFDSYCMKWFNDILVPLAKERYDITLTQGGYVTGAMVVKEYLANPEGKGTWDFFWSRSSDLAAIIDADGKGTNIVLQSDWQSKMPNVTNYSDTLADETWQNTYDSFYGAGSYSREVCSVAPFSGSTTTFIYNKDYNDADIAYDEVKVVITGAEPAVIKVALDGADFDRESISKTTVYSLSSVREVCRSSSSDDITCYYGLPHNYTEFATWVQLYPNQFYLPSATGYANFHVQLILEAMIYELAAANAEGSDWIACTDSSAYVWSHDLSGKYTGDEVKDKATYKAYIESKVLSVKTAADYGKVVPYLQAYLDDIMPYLDSTFTGSSAAVTVPNTYLIGNQGTPDDFNDDTLMISLSTVESMAIRSDSYKANIGMYMMETACSNRCGLFIPCNAPNPAGAIVIANLMNDPYVQATYYNISGNGYNADKEKLSTEEWMYFQSYISQWTVTGAPFISPDDVSANRTVASIGYKEATLSAYADPFIKPHD